MKRSSRCVVLMCEECGERTVLDGWASVWRLGDTSFGCECGERLTLLDRLSGRNGPAGQWTVCGGTDFDAVRMTTDDVLSIIAVVACLVAVVACALAH
jgi:hypothetical protein